MAKNKTRRLKRHNKKNNVSQLIKIIACQNKKQDKLLQKIEELEEYINFIEINVSNISEEEDVLISGVVFEADDEFEQILQDQLNTTPKEKLEEINKDKDKDKKKKNKNKKPKLYTIDEILKVFKGE